MSSKMGLWILSAPTVCFFSSKLESKQNGPDERRLDISDEEPQCGVGDPTDRPEVAGVPAGRETEPVPNFFELS